MNKNFSHTSTGVAKPVVFEKIFAEKPGGGMLPNQSFDVKEGTALGKDSSGNLQPIKAYKLVTAVAVADTEIEIEKGSGVASGDVIGNDKKSVASTAIDTTTNDDKDVVTVTLGVAIPKGTILYQSASASASAAAPKYTPIYLIGQDISAGSGDQEVKLINGANIRKETAPVADEVVALMKSIQKV